MKTFEEEQTDMGVYVRRRTESTEQDFRMFREESKDVYGSRVVPCRPEPGLIEPNRPGPTR